MTYAIATFEFSTLYTNFPFNKLRTVIRQLINFCFKSGRKSLLSEETLLQHELTLKIKLKDN